MQRLIVVILILGCFAFYLRKKSTTVAAAPAETLHKKPEFSVKTSAALEPKDPILRALYLHNKIMQNPREKTELQNLLSDKRVMQTAKSEWLAGQRITETTNYLLYALEWKENPKRAVVISAIEPLFVLPSVSSVEQQARQTELLVRFIKNDPQEYKRVKSQIAKPLIVEAKQYFNHYSWI